MTFKNRLPGGIPNVTLQGAGLPNIGRHRLENDLVKGQSISRSYASDVMVNDMGGDGGYSPRHHRYGRNAHYQQREGSKHLHQET